MYKKILLLLGISSGLLATTITFNEALNKTLKNNESLKAKKLSIESSKLDVNTASGYNYGTLTFNENIAKSNNAMNVFGMKLGSREADFGAFGFSQFDATNPNILNVQPDDLNNPDARTNYETKVVYEIPLFTGFKLSNAKDMAKLQVMANQAKYNFDEKQLGLEVLKAYNGAVAAKYFIQATKDAKTATSSFVNFATEMYKEGYVTNIDVKQASVYDMKINTMLLEANNKYALAIAYLKFLTSDDNIKNVADFMSINIDLKNLKSLQDTSLNKRDDYKWMKLNTSTMNKKINFEKSANYPMIGAHFEYGFNDDKLNNINSDKDYYTMAVGLEYTIFNGFKTTNDIQKAKIEYSKTKHYLDYMENGIKLQVEKAVLNLHTKKSVLKQKIKAQNLAIEVLEQSNEMYKNSLMKMSDLLMQQASAQESRAQAIMAKYELSIAAASLQLALGQNIHSTGIKNNHDLLDNIKIKNKIENLQIISNKEDENIIPKNLSFNNYKVIKNDSNVREKPIINSKILYILAKNYELNIESCNSHKWCKIKDTNEYISANLITSINQQNKGH